MPELPDVENFKRQLDETSLHRAIARVVVRDPGLLDAISASEFVRRVEGREIAASKRFGKHLFLVLSGKLSVSLHFGMNGALQYFGKSEGEAPYERLRFEFRGGDRLAYLNPRRIGRIGLAEDVASFVAKERLGPDALDPSFDLAALERAFSGRRREVKSLLMDQAVVAGIGNIYSDEILFAAGIHPKAESERLGPEERRRLFDSIKSVLRTAIEKGAGAEHSHGRLPPSFLLPQRKKGGRCPRCGSELQTLKFSGRTAYFCPRCQKKAR